MHSYFKNHTLAAGALLLTLDRHCLQDPGILFTVSSCPAPSEPRAWAFTRWSFPSTASVFPSAPVPSRRPSPCFTAADRDRAGRTLLAGFIISFSLALGLAAVIIRFSGFLASQVLMEPRCAPLLPGHGPGHSVHVRPCLLMRLVLRKKRYRSRPFPRWWSSASASSPSFSLPGSGRNRGRPVTVLAAVAGLVAREAGSRPFSLLSFLLFGNRKKDGPSVSRRPPLFCPHSRSPAPGHGPAPHGQPAGHEPSPEPGGHSDPPSAWSFPAFPSPRP